MRMTVIYSIDRHDQPSFYLCWIWKLKHNNILVNLQCFNIYPKACNLVSTIRNIQMLRYFLWRFTRTKPFNKD